MTSPASGFLRTNDAAFTALPSYPFAPRYVEDLPGYDGIRVHYVEQGAGDAVFLCLHGNPAWSYLYRHMIPTFATAGRVIAPDMIGFGRSDKPAKESWHTFEAHRNMLLAFVKSLDLRNITLVVQDWGGLLGLTLPMDMPERFSRLIVMNTTLATGVLPGEGFRAWRDYSNSQPDLNIGKLIRRGKSDMSDGEAAAYNAPFPDASYKAAIRSFPNLVPDSPDAPGAEISRRAEAWWKESWRGQCFAAVGVLDPVLGTETMSALASKIYGCPPPTLVRDGGHFVQEWGAPIARGALAAFALRQ